MLLMLLIFKQSMVNPEPASRRRGIEPKDAVPEADNLMEQDYFWEIT